MNSNKSRVAYAVALAMAASAPSWAAEEEVLEEVQVTGSRIVQAPGMFTPTPVTSVSMADLESVNPGSVIDGLSKLPQFFGNTSGQQALGGQNSGGSNVNLRGAGISRTLTLLDGRRVVSSNRFGTVDVSSLPEMLLANIETVTGGASASYGTDAVAGVVNFKVDTKFEGFKVKGQYGITSRDDGGNYEAGFAFGHKFGDRMHLIASYQHADQNAISSFESLQDRSWYNQASRVSNPNAAGPTFLRRAFVEPTNYSINGLIVENGSSLNRLQFNDAGNALAPLPFSGVGSLNAGCLCQATPTQGYGVSADDEVAVAYKRQNAYGRLGFQLNDNVELFAEGIWAKNAADQRRESIALLSVWQGRIYSNNAFLTPALQTQIYNGAPSANVAGQPPRTITDDASGTPVSVRFVGFGSFLPNNESNPLGDTRQTTANEMKSATAGFNWNISSGALEGWNVNGYAQKGKNRQDFNTENGIRVDRLWFALDAVRNPAGNIVCRAALPQYDTTGVLRDCVPLNLFGGGRNITPEMAAYIVDEYKVASQWIDQTVGELTMSGDLGFGLAAGDISTAFGIAYRKETLDQRTIDPADEFPALPDGRLLSDLGLAPADIRGLIPSGNTTAVRGYSGYPGLRFVGAGYLGDGNSSSVQFSSLRAISGSSNVKEAFTEFNIPLIKNQGIANNLDANIAARIADYSGSGNIWAWKAGLSWELTDQVRLRGTLSRDVRAPNLRDRFDQTRGGFTITERYVSTAPATLGRLLTRSVSGATFSGGNPLVEPEKADTTTFGIVLQPDWLEGFQTSIDWYKIKINDAIAQLTAQQLVDGCFNGDTTLCQYVLRAPSASVLGAPNDIERIDSLFINLARQNIKGIDVEMSYRRSLELFGGGAEKMSARLFATRLMSNSIQNRGSAVDQRVGEISGGLQLPRNKVTGILTYSNGPWSGNVMGRYIGDGKLDRFLRESSVAIPGVSTIDNNHVGAVFYVDLGLNFRPTSLEGLNVFATVNNLLDRAPAIAPSVIGRTGPSEIIPSIHDQIGRRYTLGMSYDF
jgi:iron complex outermembrane recepter protein